MSIVTVKDLLRYALTRKPVWAFVLNGLGWKGEIMNFEIQQSEMVLLNQISSEELAEVLVELIRNDREVQRAILEVLWACPNVVTRI